jgi:alpha-tubulin suppressor-like RCC1 family protein
MITRIHIAQVILAPLALALLALAAAPSPAASIPGIANTADSGATPDPRWTITGAPAEAGLTLPMSGVKVDWAISLDQAGFPFWQQRDHSTWRPADPPTSPQQSYLNDNSGWISFNRYGGGPAAYYGDAPAGDYVFELTFDMTGLETSTALITGHWWSDNSSGVYLNGQLFGTLASQPQNPGVDFCAPVSLLNPGLNTLAFVVNNQTPDTGTVGLRVDFSQATADPLPGVPQVVAWGDNTYGQCNVPAGLTDVVSVAAGVAHSMALLRDGTVVAWGDNTDGQASAPTGLSGVVAVAAGWWHSLALKADGTVVGWGRNDYGQSTAPAGLSGVVQVAAGRLHSVALKQDGTVVLWGYWWGSGVQHVPGELTGVVAVAAAYDYTLALKADGTVVALGTAPAVPDDLTGVVAIAAGTTHALALKNDETVVAWGDNSYGQTTLPVGLNGVTEIAAGGYHNVALKADGTVLCWGGNWSGQADVPHGLSGVVAIAGGAYHSLAVVRSGMGPEVMAVTPSSRELPAGAGLCLWARALGTLPLSYQWQFQAAGQSTWENVGGPSGSVLSFEHVQLADAGTYQVVVKDGLGQTATAGEAQVAVLPSGVMAWGSNERGQIDVPAGLADIVALSGGLQHTVALRADGTVVAWGSDADGQSTVPAGLSGVVAIAAGWWHSIAVKADGTVVAWGSNAYGQSAVPAGLSGVVEVVAGRLHSAALRADGTVVCWGTAPGVIVPTGLSGVVAVTAAYDYTLALKGDGTVVAWGTAPAVPADLSGVVAIAAGAEHALALRNDGTVVAWGNNDYEQCNVPGNLDDVVQVAGGAEHSLALKADGTVVAWGAKAVWWGQSEVPYGLSGVRAIAAGAYHSLALVGAGVGPEVVVVSPSSREVPAGAGLRLWARAVGAVPLSYQWQFQAQGQSSWQNVGGPSGSVLSIEHVALAHAGTYRVVVTDGLGQTVTGGEVPVAVLPSGVVAWGNNRGGQLDVPPGLNDAVAVAGGYAHTLALKSDGTVVAWGDNRYGQTTLPEGLSGVVGIAAGVGHSLVVKADGTVVAWGNNDYGQSSVPAGLSGVVQVVAGRLHSVALKADGTVVCWGTDQGVNVPAGLSGVVQIAAGRDCTLALKGDGTVVAWGVAATAPADLSGVVSIAAGTDHALAVKSDKTVVAWGVSNMGWGNDQGQCNVPTGLSGVVQVAAGRLHSMALREDGTVVTWGSNGPVYNYPDWISPNTYILDYGGGQAELPYGLSAVRAIAAGVGHNLALVGAGMAPAVVSIGPPSREVPAGVGLRLWARAVGTLPLSYQWQRQAPGQTAWENVGGPSGSVLSIEHVQLVDAGTYRVVVTDGLGQTATGGETPVAVLPSGVVAWGNTYGGQVEVPPGLNDAVAVAGGYAHTLALKSDGTVVAWGYNANGQSTVPAGLSGVVGIAAGFAHSVVVKADGTVVAWGLNDYGQSTVPAGLSGVVQVVAGRLHSAALKADGTVVAWGWYDEVPAGLSGVVALAADYDYTLALKGDGTVVAWGVAPTVPADLSGVVAIAAGAQHALAVKSDGTVVAWGLNDQGQCNVPVGLSGVVQVAAGQVHSMALRQDGTVVTWGSNGPFWYWSLPSQPSILHYGGGQAEIPYGLSGARAIAAGFGHNLAVVGPVPPLLVLLDSNPMTVELGGAFADPGATARDVRNVDISSRIVVTGSVDSQHVGTYSLIYTVTTDDGRTTSRTRTVKVVDSTVDTTPPTVTCPPAITLPVGESCQAAVPDILASVLASDDRGGPVALSQDPAAGTLLSPGAYTITVTARDEAGNPSSCTVPLTIVDSMPPIVSCPADRQLQCGESTDPSHTGSATATDNCGAPVSLSYHDVAKPVRVTVTVASRSGPWNASVNPSFVYGRGDEQGPAVVTVTAGEHIFLGNAAGQARAGFDFPWNGPAGYTSDPGGPIDGRILSPPYVFPSKYTPADWPTYLVALMGAFADASGLIVGQPFELGTQLLVVNVPAGASQLLLGLNDDRFADNGGSYTVEVGGVNSQTVIERTWTGTDASGNTSTCVQQITFADTTPPVVVCPPTMTAVAEGNCQAPIPDVLSAVTASDNCGDVALSQNPPAGALVGLGPHTITVTATDASGNSSTCTTMLTVVDESAPVLGPISAPVDPVEVNTVVNVSAGFTDNCGPHAALWDWGDGSALLGTVVEQNGSGTVSGSHTYTAAGVYTVVLMVMDQAEHTTQASFTITVTGQELSALAPAQVWIGLKNSDDVGTKFDLLAKVFKNGALIGSGQLDGVPGGSSGFNNAVSRTINLALPAHAVFVAGDTLSFRLSVRIAVNVSGHRSGTARLWFNDAAANSQVGATLGGVVNPYYLLNGSVLGTSAGPGPKKTIDVFVDKAVGGNPFKPFGTWSRTF